jgi:biotin operon repressor
MKIIDFIPEGQANAIPTKELIQKTGLSQRQVCAEIEKARAEGEVILSKANGGYWLPDENKPEQTIKELRLYIGFMDSRNTFKTTASARKMLRDMQNSDQGDLWQEEQNNVRF